MKILKGVTLVTAVVLALAAQGGAAGGVTTSVYTVGCCDGPGSQDRASRQRRASGHRNCDGHGLLLARAADDPLCRSRRGRVDRIRLILRSCFQALPESRSSVVSGTGRGWKLAAGRRRCPGRGSSCWRERRLLRRITRAASRSPCPTPNPAYRATAGPVGAQGRRKPRALRTARSKQEDWTVISAHPGILERAWQVRREGEPAQVT